VISSTSEIHSELERVLASRWLRESHQLCALLRHVVEAAVEGNTDGLKEYSLGLEVFRRSPDYDPRNDAIVRVQASLLRKRLAAYYENEGADSAVMITLPRGGYVPEFITRQRPVVEPIEIPRPPHTSVETDRAPKWRVFAVGLMVGALVVVAAVLSWSRWSPTVTVECPELWAAFLEPGVETVASFGVPLFFSGGSGLYIRDTQVNRLSDARERIDQAAQSLGRGFVPQEDVYTGVGDAIGTHYVARWLERKGVHASVTNSNYLGPSDVEGKNLVVVASARFQTLLQQMDLPREITFNPRGAAGGFELKRPLEGEAPFYSPKSSDTGVSVSYALVSLWPGSQADRRILYLSGIETWSTQGAAHFVLDSHQMDELHRRMQADPEDGPLGRKSPYFQVLLRVEGKKNIVRTASYVTHRYLPNDQLAGTGRP
jgi:hypothetical protein